MDYNGNVLTYNGSSWSSPDSIDPGRIAVLRLLPDGELLRRSGLLRQRPHLPRPASHSPRSRPTSASIADSAGYSGQLAVTNATGTVSYTETASTDSTNVVVSSTGAISAATSLHGTYSVGGTDGNTNGDTGTWSFALTVRRPFGHRGR